MTTPLELLRLYVNSPSLEIKEEDDLIVFGNIAWHKDIRTNFRKYVKDRNRDTASYYTLNTLLCFARNSHYKHEFYVEICRNNMIDPVLVVDRNEVLAYLSGKKTENVDYIPHATLAKYVGPKIAPQAPKSPKKKDAGVKMPELLTDRYAAIIQKAPMPLDIFEPMAAPQYILEPLVTNDDIKPLTETLNISAPKKEETPVEKLSEKSGAVLYPKKRRQEQMNGSQISYDRYAQERYNREDDEMLGFNINPMGSFQGPPMNMGMGERETKRFKKSESSETIGFYKERQFERK